jgi:hypothetical protein
VLVRLAHGAGAPFLQFSSAVWAIWTAKNQDIPAVLGVVLSGAARLQFGKIQV